MSLMSGLFVGVTGLQTSQNALNTTAHNLSNVETTGYVRQQVLLQDKIYSNVGMASVSKMQTGLGVEYAQVRQVRDAFLDQSYRKENGRSAFYEVNYDTTSEIETLLGEFDGVAFQDSIDGFWTAVQELQKDPASAVTEGALVNTATQFLERAQAVYNGLCDYQDNLNSRIKGYVDEINELGETIRTLNDKIMREEIGESEANDLRDQRNYALDKLGALVNMSYSSNADGGVDVMIEGVSFVNRDVVFKMDAKVDLGTGFYTPVWPQNEDSPVFFLNQEISTDHNTDIGQLKAIVLARGDRRANYTDIEESVYNRGVYNPGTPEEQKLQATSSSIVMNVQAELDKMAHAMVTTINNILTKEYNPADPTIPVSKSYAEGDKLPDELFVRLGTPRYEKNGSNYEYVEEDSADHANVDSLYTLSNLKINPKLQKTPTELGNGFVTEDKKVDQKMADDLADAFTKTFGSLNPNLTQQYNYQDFYAAMVGQVATTGSVYQSIVTAQEAATQQLDDSRQMVIGVSTNEELSNMIKYQNAYNAASRYINACNQMLEHLLNTLG